MDGPTDIVRMCLVATKTNTLKATRCLSTLSRKHISTICRSDAKPIACWAYKKFGKYCNAPAGEDNFVVARQTNEADIWARKLYIWCTRLHVFSVWPTYSATCETRQASVIYQNAIMWIIIVGLYRAWANTLDVRIWFLHSASYRELLNQCIRSTEQISCVARFSVLTMECKPLQQTSIDCIAVHLRNISSRVMNFIRSWNVNVWSTGDYIVNWELINMCLIMMCMFRN